MRVFLLLAFCALLISACGSGPSKRASTPVKTASVPFASGPISNACLAADRKKASRRVCGCVQAVANQRLSSADQSRAAGFIRDPQKAQDSRSSRAGSFWSRYKSYTNSAKRTCAAA